MIKTESINRKRLRSALVALSGITIAFGFAALRGQADEWNKKTVLTINQPMQIRETLLQPGQYVLMLADSSSDRHIVQIFNADQSHLINTVMAVPAERLQPTGKSRFVMWETPAGSAAALKQWYYPGDNFGQEFPYPKNLTVIAQNTSTTYTPPPPAPAPQEQPQAAVQEPPAPQPPAEIAQNTPPPPPPAATEPAPAPTPAPPAQLPKTASPYPMIGLAGLLLLGVGRLLRQPHSA
jgi:outer membrane biosynthesis protein TonB